MAYFFIKKILLILYHNTNIHTTVEYEINQTINGLLVEIIRFIHINVNIISINAHFLVILHASVLFFVLFFKGGMVTTATDL